MIDQYNPNVWMIGASHTQNQGCIEKHVSWIDGYSSDFHLVYVLF